VIDLGIADGERLGVASHSYGGSSTLALITQTNRFKVATSSAGSANLIGMYGQMGKDGSAWATSWSEDGQGRMGGTRWQFRSRYIENSQAIKCQISAYLHVSCSHSESSRQRLKTNNGENFQIC
jgi:dipeptidyl aminopeptidase/acylaminoacyl peptidase